MATRLQHPVHGFTHAYSTGEAASLQSAGWKVCDEPQKAAAIGKFEPPAGALPGDTYRRDAFSFVAAPVTYERDALIPAQTLDEMRDAMGPVKRKPGRPPKAK